MSRKSTFEKAEKQTSLKKPDKGKKKIKQLTWQLLFENKSHAFTVKQIAEKLDTKDRKTIYDVLAELQEVSRSEQSKSYKVYKIDSTYRIFDEDEYEEYKSEQKSGKSIMDRINEESYKLDNPKMWTSDEAELISSSVIFYPLAKRTSYYNKVKESLNWLFSEYIVAILEGEKEGKNGLFIILREHKETPTIMKHIKTLYHQSAVHRER